MDLLNRYLNAVAARLPEGQREEIAAEIREGLLSRIEDAETRLHRPLTEPEVVALLKTRGHPLVVAASYTQQQYLISPALLPFYWFAMQVVVGTDLLAHFVYGVTALAGGEDLRRVLTTCFSSLWVVTMYLIGTTTFSALVLDRAGVGRWLAGAWSPRFLLKVPARKPTPSVFAVDLIVIITLTLCVSGTLPVPAFLSWPSGMQVRPSHVWSQSGVILVLLAIALLVIHCVERFLPVYRVGVLTAKLIHSAAILLVIAALVRGRPWFVIPDASPASVQTVVQTLNVVIRTGLVVGAAITSIKLAGSGTQLLRVLRARSTTPNFPRPGQAF